jgi:hypothetical protein
MSFPITIVKHYDPFPFLEVKDLYDEDELQLIWQELEFLNQLGKLKGPENTGSAVDLETKVPLKENKGLIMDNVYTERTTSNILSINPKIFCEDILNAFTDLSFSYELIKRTNYDTTIISYYENGGYYKPHEDKSIFTAVTWFFKEPKAFSGGDFHFSDYDLTIKVENNCSVIFPSFVKHAVDEIIMKDKSLHKHGRYAMTQFCYILP